MYYKFSQARTEGEKGRTVFQEQNPDTKVTVLISANDKLETAVDDGIKCEWHGGLNGKEMRMRKDWLVTVVGNCSCCPMLGRFPGAILLLTFIIITVRCFHKG